MERFNQDGMLKIPGLVEEVQDTPEFREKLTVQSAFCHNGHSLIDNDHRFAGAPGIRLAFVRPNGERGLFVVAAKLNDTDKVTLEGQVVNGEKVALLCPVCGEALPILASCDRCDDGEMVLVYASELRNVEDSISFCNVVGCPNALFIRSDRVIRAIGREVL
jgi:hypothetical protein